MSDVSKIAAARLLDPTNAALDGQARVNAEIFTAVEILGRKLERVEGERDRLARRLALIESAATVDEKTGKLYLPVVANQDRPLQKAPAIPKWMVATTLMSSAVALFALGLVLFRDPAPSLTKEQLAALNSLSGMQFTQLAPESKSWRSLATEPQQSTPVAAGDVPQQPTAPAQSSPAPAAAAALPQPAAPVAQTTAQTISPAPPAPPASQLPNPAELAKLEQGAEAPKPVETAPTPLNVAAAPTPSTEPPSLPPPETAAIVDPQKVLIPGEDKIPENDKTAGSTVVPKSERAGGIAPDTSFTDKKLVTLQKRAYQGIPEAQHDLATLYAAGTVIPQDYHRAAFWFAKAADGGIANAHYNMGVIYHQGLGVPVDLAKALSWYEKAAELGHPEAMYNLGIAYIEGVGTKVDIDKGVSYFKRASKAGVAQAAYNLGVLYESNFIGPIDLKKAAEWYQIAAKQGHAQARDALARLQQSGNTSLAADSGDQARTLADKIEPSGGGDEETGEGDSSPVSEIKKVSDKTSAGPKTLLGDIQRILIKQGLLPGKADGVLSPQTEDVIRAAQKKFGMPQDGQPSQELLEKLLEAPPSADKAFP